MIDAETGKFRANYINTLAADDLAPCFRILEWD